MPHIFAGPCQCELPTEAPFPPRVMPRVQTPGLIGIRLRADPDWQRDNHVAKARRQGQADPDQANGRDPAARRQALDRLGRQADRLRGSRPALRHQGLCRQLPGRTGRAESSQQTPRHRPLRPGLRPTRRDASRGNCWAGSPEAVTPRRSARTAAAYRPSPRPSTNTWPRTPRGSPAPRRSTAARCATALGDWLSRPLDTITRRDVEARFHRISERHGWAVGNHATSLLRSVYREAVR